MDGSLPELRTDWLLGRSVFVAENRAQRPNEFGEGFDSANRKTRAGLGIASDSPGALVCPFCRGQEHRTPAPVFELTDECGQWQTRVVPNRFPAVLRAEPSSVQSTSPAMALVPGQSWVPAQGVHEVIIESPRHADRMGDLSQGELRDVLETYVLRLRQWRSEGRFRYGLVFKNQGPRAGASLSHLHSQLIALPDMPPLVAAEYDRAAAIFHDDGFCPYCRLVEREQRAGLRIVHHTHDFVIFCPFAGLQPYELWLMPTQHRPFFEDLDSDSLDRLAVVLRDVIPRLEAIVPESAYNLLLRTAPWHVGGPDWSHWRIEILPRSSSIAGFELASGMFINSLAPERAASKLRSI